MFMFIMSQLPLIFSDTGVSNLNYTNLYPVFTPDPAEHYCLGLGCNFISTPPAFSKQEMTEDWRQFDRRVKIFDCFYGAPETRSADEVAPRGFYIPNPDFHPDQCDYEPSVGVIEYTHKVLGDFYDSINDAPMRIWNLSKRHRDALVRLKARRDIVIVDSDKT
jgi:hypothetical protein